MTSTIEPSPRRDGSEPARQLPEQTPAHEAVRLLEQWHARLLAGATDHREALEYVERAIATITSLQDETQGLRRALLSRATIDQAKGMIMADRRCDADAAFQVLAKMSADTNVPLRDVARAIVYQAIRH